MKKVYRDFINASIEVFKNNDIEVPRGGLDVESFRKLSPGIQLIIIQNAIANLKDLWNNSTIKIDIEPQFIYDILLRDIGYILEILSDFYRKYPAYHHKGLVETEIYMEKTQNEIILAYKLFDRKVEPDGIKRVERQLVAFDNCKRNLRNAFDHLDYLNRKIKK